MTRDSALEVTQLGVSFVGRRRVVRAVDEVSFQIERGEIVGLVGESGCGKSTLAHAILGLLPGTARTSGSVRLHGRELLSLSESEMRKVRGKQVSLIVQNSLASLNPVISVGEQVADVVLAHESVRRSSAMSRARDMLGRVGISEPDRRMTQYPHELSGGMQQRVVIAAGIVLSPDLIVADEPTTALDVTVQAKILDLLAELKDQVGSAVLYVTHDLTVAADLCDRIVVMYAGRVVEHGSVATVLNAPRHPYTRALLRSIPPLTGEPPEYLPTIGGRPPEMEEGFIGCPFAPRCDLRSGLPSASLCTTVSPSLSPLDDHSVSCHYADGGA